MIEKIFPDRISLTLPTVFGEELTFLEFCGKVRVKLDECIDVVNEDTSIIEGADSRINANTANIQQNTTDIQKNTAAISANQSNITALSAKVDKNTTDIQQNASAIQQNTSDIQSNANYINTIQQKTAENIINIEKNEAAISANTSAIQQNTTAIQQNATAISKNESDIVKLNGVINSVSAQADENTIEIAENKTSISTLNTSVEAMQTDINNLSKNFELVEQFTLTEDVTQIYRNQKPNGEAYNFNDVIMTLNIPIIEEGSTEAYGGTFVYIVNSETDTTYNRVVAQGGIFKKGQSCNISVRAKIEGGMVFGDYAASASNLSNKQSAFTSYSNMSMLSAENITSVLFTFFGQPIFSGTTIKIYAR